MKWEMYFLSIYFILYNSLAFYLQTVTLILTNIAALVTVYCYVTLLKGTEVEIRGNCMICSFIFLLLLNI